MEFENGNYAWIVNGIVENTIWWNGNQTDPDSPGYIGAFPDGVTVVPYTDDNPAIIGLHATQNEDGSWTFEQEPPHVPTPAEILAANMNEQIARKTQAAAVMAPILVNLQLGDATDEETLNAKAWQQYYRDLEAVNLTQQNPDWPIPPNIS